MKKYVHYRNTHTYTHYYSYTITYFVYLRFIKDVSILCYQYQLCLWRRHTLSAFHVISDISLIIIKEWIVITTCQLLP